MFLHGVAFRSLEDYFLSAVRTVYSVTNYKGWSSSNMYSVILSVLEARKCEYLKDYSLDFEHAYMTTYLAS